MKRFFQIYIIIVLFFWIFSIFDGYEIFDLNYHFWIALLASSFMIAIVINAYICQAEKIEHLEKRIEELEKDK